MAKDKVTLKIPRPLYERLKTVIQESGFSSVNEFVVYILRDAEEIEAIQQRLKNLGYF